MHVLFFLRKKDLYKVDINEELFLSNGNDQTQVKNVDIYFWNTTYCWKKKYVIFISVRQYVCQHSSNYNSYFKD